MRPKTLAEVATLAVRGDSFDRCLANFLDEFYASPNAAALADAPALLAPQFADIGRVQDAYIAATAEELARRFNLPAPTWTMGAERYLHQPWFATPLASVRTILLQESPPAFRARNLLSAKTPCRARERSSGSRRREEADNVEARSIRLLASSATFLGKTNASPRPADDLYGRRSAAMLACA